MSHIELKQRLAAILAADVEGYSRLMSLDERATVAALDTARKVFRVHIESSQGRVIDMAGDSVLAVFETATGAVSAALAVQAELGKLSAGVAEVGRMRFRNRPRDSKRGRNRPERQGRQAQPVAVIGRRLQGSR